MQASIVRTDNDAKTVVEKLLVEPNKVDGFRVESQRGEAQKSLATFADRYKTSCTQALELLARYWKDQSFIALEETKTWMRDSGIVLKAGSEIKDVKKVLRSFYGEIDKFVYVMRSLLWPQGPPAYQYRIPSSDVIKIVAPKEPEAAIPKPNPTDTAPKQPVPSVTPELIKAILAKDVDLRSDLRINAPERIKAGSLVTFTFDFFPRDTAPLHYRYVDIQFRAARKNQQLFVAQTADKYVSVDASLKSAG